MSRVALPWRINSLQPMLFLSVTLPGMAKIIFLQLIASVTVSMLPPRVPVSMTIRASQMAAMIWLRTGKVY